MPGNMIWDAQNLRWVVNRAEAPQPPPADWFRILDDVAAAPPADALAAYARAAPAMYDMPPGLVKRKRNIKPPAPPEIPAYEPPKDFTMTTPAYYMPYDTLDEVNLRLVQSIIRLHGKAVYIIDANVDEKGEFILWFRKNLHGDVFKHVYKEGSGFDLSPFKARYIASNGYGYWTYRKPVRGCYKQGACSKNTFMKLIGKEKDDALGANAFMQAFNNEPVTLQAADAVAHIKAQRDNGMAFFGAVLSPYVAMYLKDRQYRIEYKGNPIGVFDVKRNTLVAETPEITANLWAIRRLDAVGITLG